MSTPILFLILIYIFILHTFGEKHFCFCYLLELMIYYFSSTRLLYKSPGIVNQCVQLTVSTKTAMSLYTRRDHTGVTSDNFSMIKAKRTLQCQIFTFIIHNRLSVITQYIPTKIKPSKYIIYKNFRVYDMDQRHTSYFFKAQDKCLFRPVQFYHHIPNWRLGTVPKYLLRSVRAGDSNHFLSGSRENYYIYKYIGIKVLKTNIWHYVYEERFGP